MSLSNDAAVDPDLLEMLAEELAGIRTDLDSVVVAHGLNKEANELADAGFILGRLAEVGQFLDAPALIHLADWYRRNFDQGIADGPDEAIEQISMIGLSLYILEAFSLKPSEEKGLDWLETLDCTQWSICLEEDKFDDLRGLFGLPVVAEVVLQDVDEVQPLSVDVALQTILDAPSQDDVTSVVDTTDEVVAQGAQIILQHDPDVDPRLLAAFSQETPDQAVALSQAISGSLTEAFTASGFQSMQRLVHTIKGSATLVGYGPVAALAHAMEDVLEPLSEQPKLLSELPEISELLLEGGDQMAALFDAIDSGDQVADPAPLTEQFRSIGQLIGIPEEEGETALFGENERSVEPHDSGIDTVSRQSLDPTMLVWDDQLDDELVDSFFVETAEHIDALGVALNGLETQPKASLKTLERLAHTLKRSSLTLGIRPLADLTEVLEHGAEMALQNQATELHPFLVVGIALLEELFDAVQGIGDPPVDFFVKLADFREAITQAKNAQIKAEKAEKAEKSESEALPEPLAQDASANVHSLRVPVDRVDHLMRLMGEMTTTVSQLQGQLSGAVQRIGEVSRQGAVAALRLSELDDVIARRRGFGATTGLSLEAASGDATDAAFDALEMDQYHELHGLTSAFAESLVDSRSLSKLAETQLRDLSGLVHMQERLSRDLSGAVLATRMVQVETLVPRIERAVRETARETGKEVNLRIEGRDLLVDTDIVNGLRDPLMHMLRNAVDHGIESAPERLSQGKNPNGQVLVRFAHEGNRVLVTLEDDGRGFDLEVIAAKARAKGLIDEQQTMDEAALLKLLLRSGFSTRDAVNTLSGRGVGMDVVQQAVNALGGSVRLHNREGVRNGTQIQLRLPVTLVSVPVLLVHAQGTEDKQVFAIPADDIEQILFNEPEAIQVVGNGMSFQHGGREHPLHSLDDLLMAQVTPSLLTAQAGQSILLLHSELGGVALVVDEALDRREVVTQSLGQWLPDVVGVKGACTLADGRVAPVLELHDLLVHGARQAPVRTLSETVKDEAVPNSPRPKASITVLVVDDSYSARLALQLAVEQAGYECVTAIDGIDAIEVMEKQRPDLVLLDLEMPRMNGLEFSRHLRANVDTREVPIIMVTSRSSRKHRQQAEAAGVNDFVTKPFAADVINTLLGRYLRPKTGRGSPAEEIEYA